MPYNTDQQTRKIKPHAEPAVGSVIDFGGVGGDLRCPYRGCECHHHTHVVDVVWECDPSEGDRRWVRLEIRCEEGRGYFLLIRNHAGQTRLEYELIEGDLSPFAEGVRW